MSKNPLSELEQFLLDMTEPRVHDIVIFYPILTETVCGFYALPVIFGDRAESRSTDENLRKIQERWCEHGLIVVSRNPSLNTELLLVCEVHSADEMSDLATAAGLAVYNAINKVPLLTPKDIKPVGSRDTNFHSINILV